MDSRVVDLALSHGKKFERQGRTFDFGASVAMHLEALSLRIVKAFLIRVVKKHASYCMDQAVWFKGAARDVEERIRDEAIDPEFVAIDKLRGLEQHLFELRKKALSNSSKDSRTQEAMSQLAVGATSFYESVRELRGALQSYEADRCALLAEKRTGSDSAELLNRAFEDLRSRA